MPRGDQGCAARGEGAVDVRGGENGIRAEEEAEIHVGVGNRGSGNNVFVQLFCGDGVGRYGSEIGPRGAGGGYHVLDFGVEVVDHGLCGVCCDDWDGDRAIEVCG